MTGIPTPTCDPSEITPDDTRTGFPVGAGGAVEVAALLDALDEPPPAGAPAVRVTVWVGPGRVSELHADAPRAATTTAAVRVRTARGRRPDGTENAEVTASA
jgi:hypothetical protein